MGKSETLVLYEITRPVKKVHTLTNSTEQYLCCEAESLQLVIHLSAFYGARKFSMVFTTAIHFFLSWTTQTHSTFFPFISLISILILSSHTRLVFHVVSVIQISPPISSVHFSSSQTYHLPRQCHHPLICSLRNFLQFPLHRSSRDQISTSILCSQNPNCENKVHTRKTTDKVKILRFLILIYFYIKRQDNSGPNCNSSPRKWFCCHIAGICNLNGVYCLWQDKNTSASLFIGRIGVKFLS
jgi:hypothetical protein